MLAIVDHCKPFSKQYSPYWLRPLLPRITNPVVRDTRVFILFFSFFFFFRSCKLKINNASIHHSQSLNEKCSRKTGNSYQFTSCERNAMFFHDTLAGRPPKKKEGVLAMMTEPARKTSLEKKHLHNCGYFAIISSCSHFTMLTKNPATGLVWALSK